jgi:hypothetical protein
VSEDEVVLNPGPEIVFVITAYDLNGESSRGFSQAEEKEATMSENKFPADWDEAKVRRVLAHYEEQTEEDALAEDEAGVQPSETVMNIPHELVPKVRELIAKRRT